jgi:hypothetical protein
VNRTNYILNHVASRRYLKLAHDNPIQEEIDLFMLVLIDWIKRHSVSPKHLSSLFEMVCCDPLWYKLSVWIIEQGNTDALVKNVLTSFMSPSVTIDPYDDRPQLKETDTTLVEALTS